MREKERECFFLNFFLSQGQEGQGKDREKIQKEREKEKLSKWRKKK